MSIMARKGFCA